MTSPIVILATGQSNDGIMRSLNWTPHPRATVGPRVQALLDKRAEDRRLTREYGPCLT